MVTQRPETFEATPAPLVTITFQSGQSPVTIVKHWYHVPREGEAVYVTGPSDGSVPEPVIAGRVGGVRWDTDGSVAVFVR